MADGKQAAHALLVLPIFQQASLPTVPSVSDDAPSALKSSFTTGAPSQPMGPPMVEWRDGNGMSTGRHVIAGVNYLYDATHVHVASGTYAVNPRRFCEVGLVFGTESFDEPWLLARYWPPEGGCQEPTEIAISYSLEAVYTV